MKLEPKCDQTNWPLKKSPTLTSRWHFTTSNLISRFSRDYLTFSDCHQILLLILSKSKRINLLLFGLKSLQNPNVNSLQCALLFPLISRTKWENFYFHTSLRCLKRFYEGLKGFHKIFWGTEMKCKNKNLS